MLISDSMFLLWLTYAFLSLVVLVTGYLGLAFLPRLPRLVTTWLVAGVMWVPSRFHLPLLEEGEVYSGFAPAVMVMTIAFLEDNAALQVPAALLVVAGALAGAMVGTWLWWRGRRHGERGAAGNETAAGVRDRHEGERREPVIG